MHTADNRIFLKFCCIINATAYIHLNWFIAHAYVIHLNIFEYHEEHALHFTLRKLRSHEQLRDSYYRNSIYRYRIVNVKIVYLNQLAN